MNNSALIIILLISIYLIQIETLWFPRLRLPFIGRKDRYNASTEIVIDQYNGLKNLGNTCYINSILQGLYHIPIFRDKIINTTFIEDSIGYSLQSVFKNLKETNRNIVDPRILISKLGVDTRIQEDAQEFLLKLIDKLNDNYDNNNNNNLEEKNEINNMFNGELINTIKCLNVDYKKERKQKFIDISVDIDGFDTLDQSLHNLFEPIKLDGQNQYKAGEYGLQDAIKSSKIISSPEILFIHLKRFAFDMETGSMRKISNKLEFPFTLNMNTYINSNISSSDNDNIYELKAIIIHEGNVNFGHYTCYANVPDIKNKSKQKWIDLNDQFVNDVDENNIIKNSYGGNTNNNILSSSQNGFSKNAYLLFYQKI
jgi:ubiquitin carboxyl-terminal hydrolase 7